MAANLEKRDIATCIILSIVTCGFYAIYWLFKMGEDVAKLRPGMPDGAKLVLLGIVTCGIYILWWMFQASDVLRESKQRLLGAPGNDSLGIICLVLHLCGLGIVSYALIQQELNSLADAGGGSLMDDTGMNFSA